MYELTGKLKDLSISYKSEKGNLAIEINEKNELMRCFDQLSQCDKVTIKIEKYREKRSLNANSYMWILCSKLAEERSKDGERVTKEDVYRDEISQLNIYKDFENLSPEDAKTLQTAWSMLGTGWITEQVDFMPDGENVIIRCYYGSSKYNTKQMSKLLDNIVQDCQALGIETKTPNQLAELISLWKVSE